VGKKETKDREKRGKGYYQARKRVEKRRKKRKHSG